MWPEGMVLVPYTYGPGSDFAWSRLRIKLDLSGADFLVFNGEPILGSPPEIRLGRGTQGIFDLPAVDQPGITSPDGSPMEFFAFDVEVDYIEGNTVTTAKRKVQPLSGQQITDLDSLPTGGTGVPETPGGGGEPGVDSGFNYPLANVTTITIPHSLARIPNVDIYELIPGTGTYRQVDADVTPTLTTVVVQFPSPFTGLAAIS